MLKRLIVLVLLGGALSAGAASGQNGHGMAGSASRIPVLLAVVDTLPYTAPRFRIVRLADNSARYVVVLPADVTSELLSEAVENVRIVSVQPDPETPRAMFRAAPGTADSRPRRELPWAERVIRDLRDARERHVPGVGQVRAVQIWLAPRPAEATRTSVRSW